MKIRDTTIDFAEFERLYREKRPLYEEFTARIHELIEKIITNANIPIAKTEARTKTIPSFLEKIERKSYTHPFEEMKDLSGIRIITYYQDSVDKVIALIHNEFEVDPVHSGDRVTSLGVSEFGYRSVHLIMTLPQARCDLPEWQHFAGLSAEIQIRSILQHAWAAMSHKFDYKNESQFPPQLRRRLFRLSALLELVDEEFKLLLGQAEEITAGYRAKMSRDEFDVPLNLDSLREFIDQKVDVRAWEQFGVQAGMEPFPELNIDSRYKAVGLEILLRTLEEVGISTIAEFERLFPGFDKMSADVQRFVELVKAAGKTVHAVPLDVLILLVSFSKADAISPDFYWGGRYRPFIVEALRTVCREQSRLE